MRDAQLTFCTETGRPDLAAMMRAAHARARQATGSYRAAFKDALERAWFQYRSQIQIWTLRYAAETCVTVTAAPGEHADSFQQWAADRRLAA